MNVPPNQTTSFSVYMQTLHNSVKAPAEFIRSKLARIERAYDMGEPVAFMTDELQLLYNHRPTPTKTPRQLAKRVVTAKPVQEFRGAGSLQKAQHMARYGHRDWLWYVASDGSHAIPRSTENIKRMLLATGTKRAWALIGANDGCPMKGFWAMGINILAQSKRGLA